MTATVPHRMPHMSWIQFEFILFYFLDSILKIAHHTKNKEELKLSGKRQIDRYQHQDDREVKLSDKDLKQSS